jgi:hypothetical protein
MTKNNTRYTCTNDASIVSVLESSRGLFASTCRPMTENRNSKFRYNLRTWSIRMVPASYLIFISHFIHKKNSWVGWHNLRLVTFIRIFCVRYFGWFGINVFVLRLKMKNQLWLFHVTHIYIVVECHQLFTRQISVYDLTEVSVVTFAIRHIFPTTVRPSVASYKVSNEFCKHSSVPCLLAACGRILLRFEVYIELNYHGRQVY